MSRRYDLAFIIFSAVLLFLPHTMHQLTSSTIAVDIAISLLIGSPHLFATYTFTFMEPRFRQRYPRYTWSALAMPLLVLILAIVHLDLLVTMFFFFAALHVICQAGHVTDSCRAKAGARGGDRWTHVGTLTDYGLLAASIFVLATFRFTGTSLQVFGSDLGTQAFATGGRILLFPEFLRSEMLASSARPSSPRLSQRGPRLYVLCFASTVAAGATYLAIRGVTLLFGVWPGDLSRLHYFAFYVSMLSCLLIHYYFDHFLFLQADNVVTPHWSRVNMAA